VIEPLRPARGGFLRPFGCGWFIREFLLGHAPNGSPKIDLHVGAPQADIFYHYKMALTVQPTVQMPVQIRVQMFNTPFR